MSEHTGVKKGLLQLMHHHMAADRRKELFMSLLDAREERRDLRNVIANFIPVAPWLSQWPMLV